MHLANSLLFIKKEGITISGYITVRKVEKTHKGVGIKIPIVTINI